MGGCNSTAAGSWPLTIVRDRVQQRPAVRQPQRKCLAVLFATFLAWRGRVTVRTLSRSCASSERPLRRAVLWRRRSFGTQSAQGSQFVERILTAVTTLRQQQRDVLDYLTAACA